MEHRRADTNGDRPAPVLAGSSAFDERGGGWHPIDLGGHEVVARLRLELSATPAAAGRARQELSPLRGHIPTSALEVLRLLVTELVTNSIRHGDGAGGRERPVQVTVDVFANAVRVEVRDPGRGFEPRFPPRPHEDRPGGWGLCLVDRLSDRWGVERRDGTCVWFELDRERRGWTAAA